MAPELLSGPYRMRSKIALSRTDTGEEMPAAPESSTLSMSDDLWKGIKIEHHILQPVEYPEHLVKDHRLMINIGGPVNFERRVDNRWMHRIIRNGDIDLISNSRLNQPRWHDELNIIAIAIDPLYTQRILEQDKVAFDTQIGVSDPFILQIAHQLLDEVKAGSLAGRIFGDSLTTAFVIHLASHYQGVGQQPVFAPKGKLSSAQLKHVIDYSQSHIHTNIGLDELAQQVNLSVYHFARLFKRSLGITPHQYILHCKIELAKRIIKRDKLSLTEIAYELGFTDQAHFNHAFRKAVGVTPLQYRKCISR